ncbi:two-component sensor histidine kinase [Lachnospiraceae bacterium KM106-2]|nr:two-component sensor histidine kinase [Lachnospiraceae bacterium KM106-2]
MFRQYVKNKYRCLFMFTICLLVSGIVLYLSGTVRSQLILSALLIIVMYVCFFLSEYGRFREERLYIDKIEQELDKHFLAQELLKEPEFIEARGYYELMRLASRDMCNELATNKEQLREYREFIEEWVHELKTPLTSLELLHSAETCSDNGYELERMKYILDQCLNYIRLDTLEKDYRVETFQIDDMLHELIMEERVAIRAKQLRVFVNITEEDSMISDKKWVRFIFKQLLNNAIKYSKDKGTLTFMSRKEMNMLWVGLKDEGIGIVSEDLPRIFEKGFTGGSDKRDAASGIGLYLVSKCAKQMNLKVKVESTPEVGSLFEVGFPNDNISIL